MRGIRFKLHFLVFITLAATGYFGYLASEDRAAFTLEQSRTAESLRIRDFALAMTRVDNSAAKLTQIADWSKSVVGEERRSALNTLFSALSSRDSSLVKQTRTQILQLESGYQQDGDRRLAEVMLRIERNVTFALASCVCGLLLLSLAVNRRVLRPLDRLSRRMKDFLVDRYSFQFSHPDSKSELGELERTFNSLAQRVVNTMDELKTLDQAKSEFLNIASHELRTPLTSIKGSLSLLDSGVMGHIDPSCSRLLKIAEVETDRMIRLINDLLDLAKIEAGKLPLASSWNSWEDVISKTAEGLVGLAHKASVRIKIESLPNLEVFIDRDRVQQVLTNLISNAIKFSPEGGWVHITVGKTQSNELLVNVRDQGPGIAPEDSERIFQKFRQGTTPDNPLVKGTGLGLAIAKALVGEHGGNIGVESQLGAGSVFWFTLPKWRDDESSSDEILPEELHETGKAA